MSRQATFSISDIAREFNITQRTVRFYEDQGLIAPRRDGRTRVFTRRDRTRLKLALRGKRLGLSLAEIKELICMYDTARDERTQLAEVLLVLGRRKSALLQQREDIEVVLGELASFEEQCRKLLADDAQAAASGGEAR